MDKDHRLNDMGDGCTCRTYGCKKWKAWFPEAGTEVRCKRCWTLASLYEDEVGNVQNWCLNCGLPVI